MLRAFQRATPTTCRDSQRRRAFFNFTRFSSTPPFARNESETQSYHERKILPYRRNELYKIIADVESYSNFVPYCCSSRVLQDKAWQDGTTEMEAELTVGFLAFRESYVSTVTCKPDEFVEAVASSSSPLFKTLTTVWRLQPVSSSHHFSTSLPQDISARSFASQTLVDQGPTLVTLDLAFAFANPMHATISAAFFGQVSKLMVKAFEQRCIALYGPRTD
ncbi:dehydrase and lipid transport-domain-containing protein [Boletus coccyginus]|nr:dehydrase and lipid transport-domain-containing protein [Boletus coccyginus]